jgi:transglutaminase-like putative cysteine protease
MKRRSLAAAAGAVCMVVLGSVPSTQQPAALPVTVTPDSVDDLAARHPELLADAEFAAIIGQRNVSSWRESRRDDNGVQRVLVQTLDANRTLIAEIQRTPAGDILRPSIQRFDRGQFDRFRNRALERYQRLNRPPTVIAVRPFVASGKKPALQWEILAEDGRRYLIDGSTVRGTARLDPIPGGRIPDDVDDTLAVDELHHPDRFTRAAEIAPKVSTDPFVQVRVLLDVMAEKYTYQDTVEARAFTWSDRLIDAREGGVCDELAVAMISHLRAIGLRSRLRYLKYGSPNNPVYHAVVEVEMQTPDGLRWIAVDPTRKRVNEPLAYVQGGATIVETYRADHPYDERSNTPSNDLPDRPNDDKLASFGDFRITTEGPGQYGPKPAPLPALFPRVPRR